MFDGDPSLGLTPEDLDMIQRMTEMYIAHRFHYREDYISSIKGDRIVHATPHTYRLLLEPGPFIRTCNAWDYAISAC